MGPHPAWAETSVQREESLQLIKWASQGNFPNLKSVDKDFDNYSKSLHSTRYVFGQIPGGRVCMPQKACSSLPQPSAEGVSAQPLTYFGKCILGHVI